jgi:hypothetical protein
LEAGLGKTANLLWPWWEAVSYAWILTPGNKVLLQHHCFCPSANPKVTYVPKDSASDLMASGVQGASEAQQSWDGKWEFVRSFHVYLLSIFFGWECN